MRLMCLTGYGPNLSACRACGCEEPAEPLLGLEDGSLCCRACRRAGDGTWAALCPGSLAALRYIISAPAKRLFSFRAEGAAGERLADAAERYLLAHAERKFSTLDYWKKVR